MRNILQQWLLFFCDFYSQASALFDICNLLSDGETYGIPNPKPLSMNNKPINTTKTGIAF